MIDQERAATINATEDGPYCVRNVVEIRDYRGEIISRDQETWLCRCGRSQDKPFCDSSHDTAGFSGERRLRGHEDAFKDYPGRELTVHDNRRICAHVGYCTAGAPGTFRKDQRPWIRPEGDPPGVVKQTIGRCPSGALAYSEHGQRHEERDRPPAVSVHRHGPYKVVGGPELQGQVEVPPVCAEHYTLCRCGESANKPYCDGTHLEIGFRDERN